MSFELMKRRISQSGETLFKEQIKDGQDILMYGFMDDVSYNPNIVDYYTKEPIVIKTYDQRYSAAYGFTTKYLSPHTIPIELGRLLYDTKKDDYWMCVESYNVSDIHNEGKIGKCGRFLKWQDEEGTLHKTPAIVTSASKYNNGEDGTAIIQLGSDQLMVFIQCNEDTVKLDRGKQFFIDENMVDPSVYEITRTDTALYTYGGVGFLSLIMTECAYTPTEKELEIGVCNYKEPNPDGPTISPGESSGLSASISGSDELKIGFQRKYTVSFTDKDGIQMDWSEVEFEWEISGVDGIKSTITDNTIQLLVDNEDAIGSSILLSVKVNGDVVASIEIPVVEGW